MAVDNDATCATLAEWQAGAAQGFDDVVLVTLGTGIGGGIVAGGAIQRGAHGFAGELGHMVVDPDGPPCPCGRRGCWERYASGAGLAMLARRAAADGRLAAAVAAAGSIEALRGEDVRAAALDGDDEASAVVDEFARWVALGLVNLTNLVDPAILVLGGGLAATPELYLPPVQRWFNAPAVLVGDPPGAPVGVRLPRRARRGHRRSALWGPEPSVTVVDEAVA